MKLLIDKEVLCSLVFTLALGLWLYWLWTRRNWYRFSFKIPSYFGFPFLGVVHRLPNLKYILRAMTDIRKMQTANTFCAWMGMYLVMLTSDPDIIEKILSSPELLEKASNIYQPIYDGLQGGILSSPVKEWYPHRKLINPSFNHKVIVSFLPIFHKAKKQILSKFDALVGTGEHQLSDIILQTTVRISVETTMGKVVKENDKVDENFAKEVFYCKKAVVTQIMLKFINLQWLFLLNRRFQKAKYNARNFIHELLTSKLKMLHENKDNGIQLEAETNSESNDTVLQIKKTPNIFIDHALQLYRKQKFTWNDIIAESNNMVVTSVETIATQILSTLVMLAMHPDVQEKLYDEIVSVFPEKDFQMLYEHMEQLPYLDMVLNETMRVEPPAPIIARQATKDTQLTKDILLPEDLQIIISIFHLHRNPEFWGPNAIKFNPDNFLSKNLQVKHSHAFIPFSRGARNCIGWRYALFAMKVLIAGCVRNFRYTTTFKYEDLQYVGGITLKYLVEPGIQIHGR